MKKNERVGGLWSGLRKKLNNYFKKVLHSSDYEDIFFFVIKEGIVAHRS